MDQAAKNFSSGKKFLLAGVKNTSQGFGFQAVQELTRRGISITIVHPEATKIGAFNCIQWSHVLPGQYDGIIITTRPAFTKIVLQKAAELQIKNIWMQSGSENAETIELAKKLGLNVVSGKCILMYLGDVHGFHNIHKCFNQIFGKY
ncbi:MAG: CoA-binding protein [Ignavibacteria bacterium]|nr:CoA-binding protein [Ignavibacteria bacterium]